MKTSEPKLWDELWKKDISSYDADSVLSDVEEESASIRCKKILRYLESSVGDLSGKRIIEIGCGGGIYSLIFARLGASITMLDYSSDALAIAERNLGALNLKGELLKADAFNLSAEYLGKYDVAMSFGTVEHYRYPRRLDICKAHVDVLRSGGVAIIGTPNIAFLPHEILKVLLVARRKWFLGYEGSFSRGELLRVGRSLELSDVHVVGSSWKSDVRRYVRIVRDTRTFKRLFPTDNQIYRPVVPKKSRAHWLDDFLGHDIVMLGEKIA